MKDLSHVWLSPGALLCNQSLSADLWQNLVNPETGRSELHLAAEIASAVQPRSFSTSLAEVGMS
jgi:hypothetical protein